MFLFDSKQNGAADSAAVQIQLSKVNQKIVENKIRNLFDVNCSTETIIDVTTRQRI